MEAVKRSSFVVAEHTRKAEVSKDKMTIGVDEDVLELDVSMNNAELVEKSYTVYLNALIRKSDRLCIRHLPALPCRTELDETRMVPY